MVDREIRPEPSDSDPADDIETLDGLARIAALAFAPIVIGAAPDLLGAADERGGFGHLAGIANPADVLTEPTWRRFRALRDAAAARFVALVLPRLLARPPWSDDASRDEGFRYAEQAPDAAARCWMGAGYAFASVVIRAVTRYGWPADICGSDTNRVGGGVVTGLPVEPFRFGAGFTLPRLPLDVLWLESQERRMVGGEEQGLVQAGFLPLSPRPFGTEPAFGASRSLHRPPRDPRPPADAFADAQVASQINAVLCASRFAHTIKIRGRNMVGRLRTADAIQAELWEMLMPYVNRGLEAGAELRARSPLVEAKVTVHEPADKPGVFMCAFKLRPYYQLDNLAAEFSFETELGTPAT